jgi:hypothetical protein
MVCGIPELRGGFDIFNLVGQLIIVSSDNCTCRFIESHCHSRIGKGSDTVGLLVIDPVLATSLSVLSHLKWLLSCEDKVVLSKWNNVVS